MNRSTSLFVIAALFLSGVAIGALGMHLYYWQKLGPDQPGRPTGGPMPGPRMMGWMEREIELGPDQREAIREILADSARRGGEMRRELRPRVEELMRQTSERIAEVLTEEQHRRYEELRRRQGERFDRGFLGPPGHGPRRRHPGPPARQPSPSSEPAPPSEPAPSPPSPQDP